MSIKLGNMLGVRNPEHGMDPRLEPEKNIWNEMKTPVLKDGFPIIIQESFDSNQGLSSRVWSIWTRNMAAWSGFRFSVAIRPSFKMKFWFYYFKRGWTKGPVLFTGAAKASNGVSIWSYALWEGCLIIVIMVAVFCGWNSFLIFCHFGRFTDQLDLNRSDPALTRSASSKWVKDQGLKQNQGTKCYLISISILHITFLVFDFYKCSDKDEKTTRASRPAGRSEGGVETVSLKSEQSFRVSYHSKLGAVSSGRFFKAHFRCSNLCWGRSQPMGTYQCWKELQRTSWQPRWLK